MLVQAEESLRLQRLAEAQLLDLLPVAPQQAEVAEVAAILLGLRIALTPLTYWLLLVVEVVLVGEGFKVVDQEVAVAAAAAGMAAAAVAAIAELVVAVERRVRVVREARPALLVQEVGMALQEH